MFISKIKKNKMLFNVADLQLQQTTKDFFLQQQKQAISVHFIE